MQDWLYINGLIEGSHAEYLNSDKNLQSLDLLVLAETKSSASVKDKFIEEKLSNWNIVYRFDATDNKKHMGLLLLCSKKSKH